jgi:thioredoxin 1
MPVDATPETYHSLVESGVVLVDFWGPRCQPCLALMPAMEALEESYAGRLNLVKVNSVENRSVCRDLGVMGLPTYILYRDGDEIERITGDPKREEIAEAVSRLLDGGGGA